MKMHKKLAKRINSYIQDSSLAIDKTFLEAIVLKAKALATGNTSTDDFKSPQFLNSIFEKILVQESTQNKFQLKEISLEKVVQEGDYIFPTKKNESQVSYATLWKDLYNDVEKLCKEQQNIVSSVLCTSLLSLLYKYTSFIPCPVVSLPDVSLYDHIKMTVAFATSIYSYCNEQNSTSVPPSDAEAFLFIGGDLSGIQNYIYNITSLKANKNLKGRSFYLQLLIDSIIRTIIHKCNLSKANIVYSSGGGFYLIAPNTKFVTEQYKIIKQKVSDALYKTHSLNLYCALSYTSFSENLILSNSKEAGLSTLWKKLGENLNKEKRSKYKDKLSKVFKIQEIATSIIDDITKEEIVGNYKVIEKAELTENKKDKKVSTLTDQHLQLGTHLKNTKEILISLDKESISHKNIHTETPLELDITYYFLKEENHKDTISSTPQTILYFNKDDKDYLFQHSIEFDFYGGTSVPLKENSEHKWDYKDFLELAGNTNKDGESASFKRLGVLRMDVDNLGNAFIKGFNKNSISFSKYSALSSSLDLFFKGYINTLRDSEDYNTIFILFMQVETIYLS